jgi:DNA invertase Pin-like site-specific DNA recombinase
MRAAIYVRQSDRYDSQQVSLEVQERDCRQYCQERAWTVTKVYVERHSGVELFERPALQRLLADLREGAFDVIVCWNTARFSREPDHLTYLMVVARHHGARVCFVHEDFDHDSDEGWLLRQIYGFAAKQQWRSTLKTTKAAREAVVRRDGRILPGRCALYGYRYDEVEIRGHGGRVRRVVGRYSRNAATADVVRRIFAAVADGVPINVVARQLNDDGVSTPRGGRGWTRLQVKRIVRNPAYKGEAEALKTQSVRQPGERRAYGKQVPRPAEERVRLSPEVVPPIVSQELWERANQMLDANAARQRVRASTTHADVLEQMALYQHVRCGICDRQLTRYARRNRHGELVAFYRHDAVVGAPCRHFRIMARTLDEAVWAFISERLTDQAFLVALRERMRELAGGEAIAARVQEIEATIGELSARVQRLSADLADLSEPAARAALKVHLDEAARQLTRWQDEAARVRAELRNWQRALAWLDDLEQIGALLREVLASEDDVGFRARVVRWLAITVRVWPPSGRKSVGKQGRYARWEIEWQPPRLPGDARDADHASIMVRRTGCSNDLGPIISRDRAPLGPIISRDRAPLVVPRWCSEGHWHWAAAVNPCANIGAAVGHGRWSIPLFRTDREPLFLGTPKYAARGRPGGGPD